MVALSSGGDMVTEHRRSMEGLLTHVGTADCFTTLPHPALECGIVTAWWQRQVEGDPAMRRQHEDQQRERQPQERV